MWYNFSMDIKKETNINEPKKLNVISDPYRMIQKICTGVNFAVINNNKIIITLTYKEGDSPDVLIERVVVDIDHAKTIYKVFGEVLNKISTNGKSK